MYTETLIEYKNEVKLQAYSLKIMLVQNKLHQSPIIETINCKQRQRLKYNNIIRTVYCHREHSVYLQ